MPSANFYGIVSAIVIFLGAVAVLVIILAMVVAVIIGWSPIGWKKDQGDQDDF